MKTTNFILMTAVALLTACGNKDAQYDATGVFETTEIIVSARGTGEIMQFGVEEGQTVKAGEQLGYLDMTQLELKKAQLNASQQQLNASKKQLGANKTATNSHVLDLEKQVASIKQQISNAQKEKARFQALLKDGAATQKQVDDISYQISVLQKQLAATQEQIKASNKSFSSQSSGIDAQMQGVDAQNAGVDAQKAQIDDQMKNSIITSPVDGVVLSKYAEQGEYAAPGRALLRIGDVSEMKLRAYVSADLLTRLQIGQKVVVYVDQDKTGRKEYEGTVSWISSEAEFTPKTIQTRDERSNLVYAVKITVKNDGLIKRGMYGDVKF